MQIFTWRDIDSKLQKNMDKWPQSWKRVDVYGDEIIVFIQGLYDKEDSERAFKDIFKENYTEDGVLIEFTGERLPVSYEESETGDRYMPAKSPLFQCHFKGNDEPGSGLLVPMIVFYSCTGGVGRTLSLISMAKEIVANKRKVLVIDADIESPGLTLTANADARISYLDVLGLMHFNKIDQALAEGIARLIRENKLMIKMGNREKDYFLPVCRNEIQVMGLFSTPEKIITVHDNKYIITEFIAQIGAALGADFILVDLQPGITEFSAPYLFDCRVQKIFVSSVSMQSVKGLQSIIREISARSPKSLKNAKILLTMIPNGLEESEISQIEVELTDAIGIKQEGTVSLRDEYVVRIPFEQEFLYLGNFQEAYRMTAGKILSQKMRDLVEILFYHFDEEG